jgi:hypothetical protein
MDLVGRNGSGGRSRWKTLAVRWRREEEEGEAQVAKVEMPVTAAATATWYLYHAGDPLTYRPVTWAR